MGIKLFVMGEGCKESKSGRFPVFPFGKFLRQERFEVLQIPDTPGVQPGFPDNLPGFFLFIFGEESRAVTGHGGDDFPDFPDKPFPPLFKGLLPGSGGVRGGGFCCRRFFRLGACRLLLLRLGGCFYRLGFRNPGAGKPLIESRSEILSGFFDSFILKLAGPVFGNDSLMPLVEFD